MVLQLYAGYYFGSFLLGKDNVHFFCFHDLIFEKVAPKLSENLASPHLFKTRNP